MKKPIRSFLAGVICFVVIYGCLWAVGFLIEGTFKSGSGGSDILAVTDSTSPNHQYVATTFTDMGGGAAGWCSRIVAIRRNDQQFDPKNNQVFTVQCNSEVQVVWKDASKVLITLSTDKESVSLNQKTWTDDKAVRIDYASETKEAAAQR